LLSASHAGEATHASDNRTMGRFSVGGIRPAPAGVPKIDVTFSVGPDGVATISARDRDTGAQQQITILGRP
jgi:molecular chaperone DnaK